MDLTQIREKIVKLPVARKLVESVFARMRLGAIDVKHVDGSVVRYGDPNATALQMEIQDERFYLHCVLFGDIGFGEAYVDGWWDTPHLAQLLELIINNARDIGGLSGSGKAAGNVLKAVNKSAHLLRSNTLTGARKNIQEHYDLSNEFYRLWLDETMTYSSALWNAPGLSLKEAQVAKWRSLAESLELKAGDELLEIGTGWGGFATFAAKEYGCRVNTYTISQEQFRYAQNVFHHAGVADKITVHLDDYRNIKGQYDKIVSIEMMEAIGHEFLPEFFKVVDRSLKPRGVMSFQVITAPDANYDEYRQGVDWIQKHIFPGGLLPSVGHLQKVMNDVSRLQLYKFIDMGHHYAKTLRVWDENFSSVKAEVLRLGFSPSFLRKWHYYLRYCEAAFTTRNISVVQMTITRPNNWSLASGVL